MTKKNQGYDVLTEHLYEEYCIEKAECGGGSDFPSFQEWLDPDKAERDRQRAIEERFNDMTENDTWDLH